MTARKYNHTVKPYTQIRKETPVQNRYLKAINNDRPDVFYNSRTWRKKRRAILERDNYECQRCKSKGLVSKADTVHHIKELKDHPRLGMTNNNLMSVCFRCHNIIHERFDGKDIEKRIDIPERW